MRVGIVGYGYVGKGMARMFEGKAEISVYDPMQLRNNEKGVLNSDLILICVPTPRLPNGMADTSIVRESCARFVETKGLICIKSTVPPGTTDDLAYRYGSHIHFSPEYMGEGGNYVEARYPNPTDSRSHNFCIVGGLRADEVLAFFQRVMATSARYVATTARAAELCKYMENAYLATKVAFVNEFAAICEAEGVSFNEVRDLWLCDSRVDPSHTLVFKDSRGFNGKCLPKDLDAIRYAARTQGVATPVLDGVTAYDLSRTKGRPIPVHVFGEKEKVTGL